MRYMILHAYSIFDMNVIGWEERGVSITYKRMVGSVEDKDSVMIVPLADHVKTSICPGVSTSTMLPIRHISTERLVVNRTLLNEVKNLVKASSEQVKRRHNTPIGAEVKATRIRSRGTQHTLS